MANEYARESGTWTNRQDAESAKVLWGIDDALDATPKRRDVEADEAPAKASGFQVRENLRDMDRCDALHGLELDHQAVVHDEIQAGFANLSSLVLHADRSLSGKPDAAERQLDAQRFLIDGFEIARTEKAVHLDRCPNHRVRQWISLIHSHHLSEMFHIGTSSLCLCASVVPFNLYLSCVRNVPGTHGRVSR